MDYLKACSQFLSSPAVIAWLKEQLNHLKLYEARARALTVGVQNLKKARDELQNKVEEEENRYGKGIPVEVKEWIEAVDKVIFEYEDFTGDERYKFVMFDLFTSGYLPKPGIRYRISREACDITKKVNRLLETAKHDPFSYWLGPPSMAAFFHNIGYVPFTSRDEIMNMIKAALEDPSVRMMGLHGLSGVGKTTLVKEVAKNALKAKKFDVVTMANVTRNPDIRKIQGQIADMLGMKLDEESDIARAARLRTRLMSEKESTLIVLDDLWAKLDFNMLGIPSENDNDDDDSLKYLKEGEPLGEHDLIKAKEHQNSFYVKKPKEFGGASKIKTKDTLSRYKGTKVLLISENKQVLLSQMEGKERYIFSMDVLKSNEAETLFQKIAGMNDINLELEKLAAEIVNKCNGLPMSIVTTAKALKNQSRLVWEDVHRQLERERLTGAPEFSTKLSYELLENEELKDIFLLCARMGPDALIMDLVKYCIGLGFLRGIYTVREARSRVYASVVKLKVSGLLSNSYSSDHFTMQDAVRSAALSIASKEKHVFTMTKGTIDEWPDDDKLERYTAISLHHCNIIEGFPTNIKCPKLRVFHVNNNDPRLKIPENLFEGMKELKMLILTNIHLSPLPKSIGCLTKLRMLCLENCMLDEEISIIGELKNLRILSFSGSDIEKLPVELKQLTKLQIFDISNCSKLGDIPSNVISSLISLEELFMRNTLINWKVEIQTSQSENASLSELRNLNQLTTLDIQIRDVSYLPNNLFFDKLNSYKIVIGDLTEYLETDFKMPEKYEPSRVLAIQLKDSFDNIHSQMGIKMLFDRVENLFLEDLNGVQDIFYTLNLKGFPYLKHLSIVCNSNIESLINPKDRQDSEKAFPKLESLYLFNLEKLDEICSCELLAPSFGKLKVIKISLCGRLKNVFLFSVTRLLTALETIEVSECNSLKEIVPVEMKSGTNEIELLEFPELRSLTLQSLSKFIGFYPKSSTGEESRILFHEKIAVSKLERMELSSIHITLIWDDQPSQDSYFQYLTHLDVNSCWNLTYLVSFSMAKNLVNLQNLFIGECEKMGRIFPQEQGSYARTKGSIFPNLKNIKLSSMKNLSEIWSSELPPDSFSKLDTLIIEECDKLVNVFPCNMEGIFRSLCNLKVTNCRSMEAIFDLDDRKQYTGDATNLQDVHLEALPKLKNICKWNKDGEMILNLKKLQKICVHYCNSLKSIFPVFEATCLHNLEYLVVRNCFELREIVAKEEGISTNTGSPNLSFVFPKLTTIKFFKLPKFKSLYPGSYELSCPALNDLSIEFCDKLEPFKKETAGAQRKPVFFPEQVINKLKSMQIESWHAKSSSSYIGKGNYRRDDLEKLHFSRLMNTEILYSFLHSNPNLKSLSLNNCFFKEMVPLRRPPEIQNLGVVPNLESLELIDLHKLENIGFERDMVLQRIEFLILKNCPCLVTIVSSLVSFTHLTKLEVANCKGLICLMLPSTAKSLGQLNTMKVIKCESLKEIVGNEEENADTMDIVFRRLKILELVSLKSLQSFCSSKSCAFEFPWLEKLIVSACPKMENFSEKVKNTPLLQKIYVVHEKEKMRSSWESHIQRTIQHLFEKKNFFEGMDEINVSEHPELQQAWDHDGVVLPNNWFYSLKTLKLDNCTIQPCAIPSKVFPYLKSLKELEVRACHNVEVIFDMTDTQATASQLKKLTLEGLLKLKHVWKNNHQGFLSFQNLQQVFVSQCNNMQALFPAALAKKLQRLEKLEIKSCAQLLEIVGKEEGAAAQMTENFAFPRLTTLDLGELPKLTHFYPKTSTLECPALNYLSVFGCLKLELFESAHSHGDGEGSSNSVNRQPLFFDLKAISNVENLVLDWKHTSGLSSRLEQLTEDLQYQYLSKLSLFFGLNEKKKLTFPFRIFEKAPNLLKASINYYSGSEIEWLNTVCEKLHELYVSSCPYLTKLVQSAVSFSHLKELFIVECCGLNYLFTSSVAKDLQHLEEITVKDCELMTEIVAKEQRETTPEEIIFERLDWIVLKNLSSLECFYSGNNTLQLPSLIQVNICQCPNMKVFSQGQIHAESFRGIHDLDNSNDVLVFRHDLNASVESLLYLQQDHLVLKDSPMVRSIWLQLEPVPDQYFCNLNSLVVEGCEFLSTAILPSHLLSFLGNLEELQVRKCNSVQAIFDCKINMGPAFDPLSIPLKKLILDKLPMLKHVWNEDPQGRLSLSSLTEVSVDECKSIESLFPASVAKDSLQILRVKNCDGLVEIVAKDEASATQEANKELIIFPNVTSLMLWHLPNLRCIYPGMDILKWPMLRELDVLHCQMLKFFGTEFHNFPNSHPGGQDCFPTHQQPFVSLRKVTPHLKKLSPSKEDAMMIQRGNLHVDLEELNSLKLQCFNDEFPIVFGSRVPVNSIKNLSVVNSAFKDIFPSQTQTPDTSWMDHFVANLETLDVQTCNCLTNLTPSTVTFSKLMKLDIRNCDGLKYLFTSSTAKTLCKLEEMCLTKCASIKEIVAKEGDGPDKDEIKFEKLETLTLKELPKFERFYSGRSTLIFPSLRQVSFATDQKEQQQVSSTRYISMKDFCDPYKVPENLVIIINGTQWDGNSEAGDTTDPADFDDYVVY